MATSNILTPRQQQVYEEYQNQNHNTRKTAETLRITDTAVRKHLFLVARKGFSVVPDDFCEHLPTGWQQTKTTLRVEFDETGKGVIKTAWPRGEPATPNQEQLFEYLKIRTPASPLRIARPKKVDPNIQLEWTLADFHFGMLSWRKETGQDYDMKIARRLLMDTASDIFVRAGKVKKTVLVLMGDNFHADFFVPRTDKSGHSLDVDSRFPKMLKTGAETFISAIEYCLQYSDQVDVIVLYGNHDKQTSAGPLPMILYAWFRNEPRVKIDMSPSKAHYNFWGSVATIYHHGDGTKKQRVCSKLLTTIAQSNRGVVEYFYAKQGHLHRESIEDINGVIYEVVPSPVAADSFADAAAYTCKRATVATLYHKKYGELDRYSITPHALKLKRDEAS